jgi:hypothetical protein
LVWFDLELHLIFRNITEIYFVEAEHSRPRRFTLGERAPYTSDMRLSGPQKRSERCGGQKIIVQGRIYSYAPNKDREKYTMGTFLVV